jgi:hypothetical protein
VRNHKKAFFICFRWVSHGISLSHSRRSVLQIQIALVLPGEIFITEQILVRGSYLEWKRTCLAAARRTFQSPLLPASLCQSVSEFCAFVPIGKFTAARSRVAANPLDIPSGFDQNLIFEGMCPTGNEIKRGFFAIPFSFTHDDFLGIEMC